MDVPKGVKPPPNRVLVLVSKQVDVRLYQPEHVNLTTAVRQTIKDARVMLDGDKHDLWTTNSEELADRFNMWTHPPIHGDYTALKLCRYLWSCDYVLAFWAGGPAFAETLEASQRMKKKLRLYLCNVEDGTIQRLPRRVYESKLT